MPGIMIERPKMTRGMYQSLKRHIMWEREKIKQAEQEQDEELERQKNEREMRKKKEEEDSLTLEQTREQVLQLDAKLKLMRDEKHELFSQLKKVLHQEDESRKRAQLKDHNEMMTLQQQQYQSSLPVSGHAVFMPGHMAPRTTKYMNVGPMHPQVVSGVKRPHSPSPPAPDNLYPHYPAGGSAKYPPTSYASVPIKQEPFKQEPFKQEPYSGSKSSTYTTPSTTHGTYQTAQSGHTYPPPAQHPQAPPTHQQQAPPPQPQAPPSQPQQQQQQQQQPGAAYPTSQSQQTSKYQAASQSAFQSYFAHQQKPGPEHMPQGFTMQRMPQPGFMNSPHANSNLSLQQQLEHANQKSGFSEDKFKMQQMQQSMRGLAPPMIGSSQLPTTQPSPQPPKGSIVTGYPIRTQQSTTLHKPPSTQSSHLSPHATQPRHAYAGQPGNRYY